MSARAAAERVHTIPGRARVRIAEHEGDEPFLQEVARAIARKPMVREVRASVRTGSLLILYSGPLEALLDQLERLDLITLTLRTPVHNPMHRVQLAIEEVDRRLIQESNGALSLGTLTFFGMLAGGGFQIWRGKFLPAGMTLLSYAVEALHPSIARGSARLDQEARRPSPRPEP